MRRYLPILLMFAVFAACNPKNKKKETEIKQYTFAQFNKNESAFGGSFSPDEDKLLITSNKTGIYNAFALPIDGSDPIQLTKSESESVFAISYFPKDERILYSSDKGGNEINHIYLRNTDGTVKDLTPWENAKSQFMMWKRDETGFYFVSTKRDPKFFDLYEMDIENFQEKLIYESNEGLQVELISNTGKYIVLSESITTSNNELYLYNTETKEKTHFTKHEGNATYKPNYFDLEDKNLFITSNEDSEFSYLMKYTIETGEKEKIWESNWDVMYAYQSYNEKYRVIGINEDASTKIVVLNQQEKKAVEFPEISDGEITSVSISKSEKLIKMSISKSTSPSNIYIYNFETKELKQLTNTLNPEIKEEHLVSAEVIRYKSFDGLEIPAILYKPLQADENNKVPAIVWVHGGPGGQSRVGFASSIQYFVNHGYVVLAVNNRGSSGYGKTFYQMDDRKHGDVDLKDCILAKDYLASLNYVDSEKIGIMGGSYGGYMVMAALTFAPNEFEVGVNIFGVTNWLRTLKSIPPFWESFRKALYAEMGDPFTKDSVRLYKISPLFHAKNVTQPLMVLQGANDPRVLQVESDEIVEAVKANGVPVEYVLFPDEGHGFRKNENREKAYTKILEFLNAYLKKDRTEVPDKKN